MTRLERVLQATRPAPLLGAALYFYDPIFLEITALLGFQAIWIEMEHGHITFSEAADLCRMAAGGNMLTMIRIPDTRRDNVLKAAECGPDIIDVPMIRHPEELRELIANARFAPRGERGAFSVSRALQYSLRGTATQLQQQVNDDLSLMGQIETADAVQHFDELCAVSGIDFFIGPADLAGSLGVPGQTAHPKVLDAARRVLDRAHASGRVVATACPPSDYLHWFRLGIDLLFCTNDIAALKSGAVAALNQAQESLARIRVEQSTTQLGAEMGEA